MGANNHPTTVPENAEQSADENVTITGDHDTVRTLEHCRGELCEVREDGDLVGFVFLHEIADLVRGKRE